MAAAREGGRHSSMAWSVGVAKKWRWLIAGIAIVLLAALGWWWWRGRHNAAAVQTPTWPNDMEMTFNKVRIHSVSGGKIVWEIEAERFDLLRDRPVVRMTGITRAVALNETVTEMTITATTLERNTYTGDMSITGPITMTGDKISALATFARWNAQQEILTFEQQSSVTAGEYQFNTGGVVNYDMKLATLNATGLLEMTMPGATLNAGNVLLEINSKRVTLDNAVTLSMDVAAFDNIVNGAKLPEIPQLPAGVRERAAKYQQEQTGNSAAPNPRPVPIPGRR